MLHLIWGPLELAPFRAFMESYRRHAAGLPHRLLIIFNGLTAAGDLSAYEGLLARIDYGRLVLPRPVQDIPAYFEGAQACDEDVLCFLNSYCVILADDWLAKLSAALQEPGVGLAGATGSHESHSSELWREFRRPVTGLGLRRAYHMLHDAHLLFQARRDFPKFPNPHLRTNAFMVERLKFLELRSGPFRSKEDCHRFESGRRGLTATFCRAGLQSRVVDRHGHSWPPEQWQESHTFRAGAQENLLVADNRTRDYQEADEAGRRLLAQGAWGN